MKYLYFMISRTPTRFGGLVRKLGKVQYNHASVALDEELREMYGFARLQHNTLLLAWLMPETIERYTLRKYKEIAVTIFRIPVTDEQYENVRITIDTIRNDPQFMYNFLSVVFFPVLHGFETYKSYSCIEFIMHLLKDDLSFPTDKPLCKYTPDDLLLILNDYVYYRGDLLEYCRDCRKEALPENALVKSSDMTAETKKSGKPDYFAPLTFTLVRKSFVAAGVILFRFFSFKRRA